jgi:hypothetical protein
LYQQHQVAVISHVAANEEENTRKEGYFVKGS